MPLIKLGPNRSLHPRQGSVLTNQHAQVVAGAGALAVAVWLAQAYLLPPVARWWRGADREPSPADKAAAAVAAAIQAQVALPNRHLGRQV